jgi:hypothetical protein
MLIMVPLCAETAHSKLRPGHEMVRLFTALCLALTAAGASGAYLRGLQQDAEKMGFAGVCLMASPPPPETQTATHGSRTRWGSDRLFHYHTGQNLPHSGGEANVAGEEKMGFAGECPFTPGGAEMVER